ncbi:probable cationic amino acid transporter, partial [Hyalella azteca]|uniref:Probable cationic amino acid transporter n=1 Tax=Hyalella azteca TaxID=294128 RepID=A0A979FR05_HYAAZ
MGVEAAGGVEPQHLTAALQQSADRLTPTGLPQDQRVVMKVLTTLDLTSLGVGSCVGTGMYLVAGMVANTIAGPSVILSFIIAAIASIFSGVCYAEFGVRVPNTSGGAYMYSYVTVGEFMAFVIGWNMILEELIGTAACACALSACCNVMLGGGINDAMQSIFGTVFGRPPDVLAFLLTLFMGAVLIAGVRKSVAFNNVLNSVNFCVWVFMMSAGLFYADTSNWTEHGGFMPHGVSGVLTGAATCFYGFIGFDIIATTGEEAINPVKSIPRAIVMSLFIILMAYVSSSALITLMVPYSRVDPDAALVDAFDAVGATGCKNVAVVGALAGLTVSMFGTMFSLPRIVYAMAKDGLIFKSLSSVWPVTGTPAVATAVFGAGSAVAALLFPLTLLVEMMSIGTLLAYTLVSTCVLILRYQPHSSTLVELLPESIRTPMAGTPVVGSPTGGSPTRRKMGVEAAGGVEPQHLTAALQQSADRLTPTGLPQDQRVVMKRVTRAPSDSDDDEEEGSVDSRKEDEFMVGSDAAPQHRYYGAVPSATQKPQPLHRRVIDVFWQTLPQFLPIDVDAACTEETGRSAARLVGLLYLNIIALDVALVQGIEALEDLSLLMWFFVIVLFIGVLVINNFLGRTALPFLAPCLPWVPSTAILVNIYLILKLNLLTLIRFIVWMSIGLAIYFYYGIRESTVDRESGDICLKVTSPGHKHTTTTSISGNNITTTLTNDHNLINNQKLDVKHELQEPRVAKMNHASVNIQPQTLPGSYKPKPPKPPPPRTTEESSNGETKESSNEETKESSNEESEESSNDESNESSNEETKNSSNEETEESSNEETEKSSNEETEESSNEETEESSNEESEESSNEETKKSSNEESEESSNKESNESSNQETKKSSNKEGEESSNEESEEIIVHTSSGHNIGPDDTFSDCDNDPLYGNDNDPLYRNDNDLLYRNDNDPLYRNHNDPLYRNDNDPLYRNDNDPLYRNDNDPPYRNDNDSL